MEFSARKLGAIENLYDIAQETAYDIYVQVFCVSCRRPIGASELLDAAAAWVRRHPLLRATVEIRSDGRFFVPIPLSEAISGVHFHDEIIDWIPFAEREMQRRIEAGNGPLWRLHFGPTPDGRHVLMFVANHCIIDARSFVSTCFELLDILNGRESELVAPMADAVLPSIERILFDCDVYEGASSLPDQPGQVWGHLLPRSFADPSVGAGSTRALSMVLDSSVTLQLLEHSREHEVKMTTSLSLIASLAMAQLFERHGHPVPEYLQYLTAVCLRPWLKIDDVQMGCYLTSIYTHAKLAGTSTMSRDAFWRTAKTMNDDLHHRLARGDIIEIVKSDSSTYSKLKTGHLIVPNANLYMSSLGSYTYPRSRESDSDVTLDGVFFMISLMEDGWEPPVFNSILTLNGQLCWAIAYQNKVIAAPLVDEYKTLLQSTIQWLLGRQHDLEFVTKCPTHSSVTAML